MSVIVIPHKARIPARVQPTFFDLMPTRPVSVAKLGYNMESTFPDTAGLAATKAGGALYARWQPGWSSVESYSSPGTYSLGSATETSLAYCGANGIMPIAVCGYGPPYKNVFNLTVGSAGAAIGAYTIPVTGSVSSIITPTDYVMLTGNAQLTATGKWGYYGALIDSVDTVANTITLASALTVNLTAGETLVINRLIYASPADQLQTNPSLIAYFNYLEFVAGRIAANGAEGYVSIWNEPSWAHDPWDARGKFYDTVPNGMNADTRMRMFLQYGLTINNLPSGVRIVNDSTDKSGNDGVIEQGLAPTSAEVAASISLESIHPYHNLPEGFLWNPSVVSGGGYKLLNPTVDAGANFVFLAYAEDQANIGLGRISTEVGLSTSDDYHQAVWLLRRAVASWGCNMVPVMFALAEGSGGYSVTAPTTYAPRQAYTALQTLMSIVAGIGGSGGSASNLPTLVNWGSPGQQWPLWVSGLYGAGGSILFLWLRTGADNGTTWTTWPSPSTVMVWLQFAETGHTVTSAIDVVSGNNVTASIIGKILTVNGVGESVIAITLNP